MDSLYTKPPREVAPCSLFLEEGDQQIMDDERLEKDPVSWVNRKVAALPRSEVEVLVHRQFPMHRWYGETEWGFVCAFQGRAVGKKRVRSKKPEALPTAEPLPGTTVYVMAFNAAAIQLDKYLSTPEGSRKAIGITGRRLPLLAKPLCAHRTYYWEKLFPPLDEHDSSNLFSSSSSSSKQHEAAVLLLLEDDVPALRRSPVSNDRLKDTQANLCPSKTLLVCGKSASYKLWGPPMLALWHGYLLRHVFFQEHLLSQLRLNDCIRGFRDLDALVLHSRLWNSVEKTNGTGGTKKEGKKKMVLEDEEDGLSLLERQLVIPFFGGRRDGKQREKEKAKEKEKENEVTSLTSPSSSGQIPWYRVPRLKETGSSSLDSIIRDNRKLVVLCDPTGKRTLGERDDFLAQQRPNWLKEWQQKEMAACTPSTKQQKRNAFALVHHDAEAGIFHFAGALTPPSTANAEQLNLDDDADGEEDEEGNVTVDEEKQKEEEEPQLEICFSFDTTGSMFCYLAQVRKSLKFLVQSLLLDLPSLRIAIIAHGDYCDREQYVLKRLDFSNDPDRLCDFVQGVGSTGGGDSAECYELALKDARTLSWTPSAMKALVVIGDDIPHEKGNESGGKEVELDWREELNQLTALGIHVYGVQCGQHRYADSFYAALGKESQGAHLRLAQVMDIERLIKGLCYLQATDYLAKKSSGGASSAGLMEGEDAMQVSDGAVGERPRRGEPLSQDSFLETIHKAIHDTQQTHVTIEGQKYELSTSEKAGCRFVQVAEVTYIEQNKNKTDSVYAELANAGHRITWMIGRGKHWGLIVDDRILRPSPAAVQANKRQEQTMTKERQQKEEELRQQCYVRSKQQFLNNWKQMTHGVLDDVLEPGKVCVAGGSVLRCMMPLHRRWPLWNRAKGKSQSDIDVFICSTDSQEAALKMEQVLNKVTTRLNEQGVAYDWKCRSHTVTLLPRSNETQQFSSQKETAEKMNKEWTCSVCTFRHEQKRKRCEMCDTPYSPVKGLKVIDVRTNSDVSSSSAIATKPVAIPPIQIVLYLMNSVTELLSGFDLDCCAVAYDGCHVWTHYRALIASAMSINVVDPFRLSPSYARRLLKYAKRGFAIVVPGLTPTTAVEAKKYARKLRRQEKATEDGTSSSTSSSASSSSSSSASFVSRESSIQSANGLLWLLAKEGSIDGEELEEYDVESEQFEEDSDRSDAEYEEKASEEEEDSDDEYSEQRDEKTGLLLKKSEVRRREHGVKRSKKRRKEASSEEEDGDDEYSEQRDEKTGLLLKKSEVKRSARMKGGKHRKSKKPSAFSEEEEEDSDDEYSEQRDEKTGLLLKKSEVKRRARKRDVKRRKLKEASSSSESEGGDDEYGEERDPRTGLLMKKKEARKMRRRKERAHRMELLHRSSGAAPSSPTTSSSEEDAMAEEESASKEKAQKGKSKVSIVKHSHATPLKIITDGATWHHRRSRFELSATHLPDWYHLASNGSVMPLVRGFYRWLSNCDTFAIPHLERKLVETTGRDHAMLVNGLLSTSSRFFLPHHFHQHFTKVAERLMNGCVLHVGPNDELYRLREVEFYFFSSRHEDIFTHKNPMQRLAGRWYFHQQPDGKYRDGNFKGLDITFGSILKDKIKEEGSVYQQTKTKKQEEEEEEQEQEEEKGREVYGGVLIRAVERVRDGAFFEGPCVVVNQLLEETGCASIDALVAHPRFDFAVGNTGSWLFAPRMLYLSYNFHENEEKEERQKNEPEKQKEKGKANESEIQPPQRQGLFKRRKIFCCPRVGLSMRAMNGSQPTAEQFYHSFYRFMAGEEDKNVSQWQKGRVYSALALLSPNTLAEQPCTPAHVAEKTGLTLVEVDQIKHWMEEGQQQARLPGKTLEAIREYFAGRNFSQDLRTISRFFGWCQAREFDADEWWVCPEGWKGTAIQGDIEGKDEEDDYFDDMLAFIIREERGNNKRIFPANKADVLAAFKLTPFEQVKCVILGQDPYHTPGLAHGLCFSIRKRIQSLEKDLPPSLKNIFEELKEDVEGFEAPKDHANLESWALNGVLMLNCVLTVEAHKPNSHREIGWTRFTDTVIRELSEKKEGLVFMLWGEEAQAKAKLIDQSKHHILKAGHPSPRSSVPFRGCKHFSEANRLLVASGKTPIDWRLPL